MQHYRSQHQLVGSPIGLIDAPTGGDVWFDGQASGALDDDTLTDFRGRRIGFVFQSFNLVPVLSALENVMLPLQIAGTLRLEACERAFRTLPESGPRAFRPIAT